LAVRLKMKRCTEEQICYALAQESTGQAIAEICRRLGVSEQTFYRWKKKFGAMGVTEVGRLKQLEDENAKL
jgi:putative transposase